MRKVICLVDGFNLYHAIKGAREEKLKWVDLRKLAANFLRPGQRLVEVVYFTAYADWMPEKAAKHKALVSALRKTGVQTVLGQFKEVTKFCTRCRQHYTAHEEKETDVNLATYLVDAAHKNTFDVAMIVSADSDYVHAVSMVLKNFPEKKIGVIFPAGRGKNYKLASAASFSLQMKKHHLRKSLLPDKVTLEDGSVVVRPAQYDP